ncbi:sensor histidine kinase [Cohnella sp. REN36]|uniref:sensor histidine kinase n=1 Tax=Cohnella sp. REN36 TaxID=2887347 RepID=UPI001D1454B5|nr:sensor histidine kinase [Cohnella sp. REN36]MCC3372441.1 histidine kinase [Cohnella sp. REN36]
MVNKLIESEAKYENEMLDKTKSYTESIFNDMNSIFIQLYTSNYYSNSLVDLISQSSNTALSVIEERRINDSLQTIARSHSFITDILLLDYGREKVYFYSNERDRDITIDDRSFIGSLMDSLKTRKTIKGILPNHAPLYIVPSSDDQVISVFINLYKDKYVNDGSKIGGAIINFKPVVFNTPVAKSSQKIKGNILVVDESDIVLSDTNNEHTGQHLSSFVADESRNAVVHKVVSQETGLTFIDMMNKNVFYGDIHDVQKKVLNIIFICLAALILLSLAATKMFTRRIKLLIKQMKVVEKGKFDTQIQVRSNDEIGFLEASFNNMCRKLENNIKTIYTAQIRGKNAELKALQSQINPHFMFNTLESIRMMALMNKDQQAAGMIHILGNMFRWNIRMKDLIVNVSDELEYIRAYVDLQMIRYKHKFSVRYEVENSTLRLGIPKLIIQPLVENAIHHGLGSRSENGSMIVTLSLDHDMLSVQIMDNGEGLTNEQIATIHKKISEDGADSDLYSIGLKNVGQRLLLMFDRMHELNISSKAGSGTVVNIKIPALTKEAMIEYVQSRYS